MQRLTFQGQVQDGTHNITNNTLRDGADITVTEEREKKMPQLTAGEELTNVAWR